MLPCAYSYKHIKRTNEHPEANIVEMNAVIDKFEDKKYIMTLYFRNNKLTLMFLIDKYKPIAVNNVFND